MTTAARNRLYVIALVALVLFSVIRVLPGLADEIWQDEAATLLLFAAPGLSHALTDYTLPNNHILLSAISAALWTPGQDPAALRLLMLACWTCTLLLLVVTGLRMIGRAATLVALAILGAHSLVLDFGLQLRGYAFSWPWLLLTLLAATRFMRSASLASGAALGASALAGVMILPTNLLGNVLSVILAAAHHACTRGPAAPWGRRLATALVLVTAGIGYYALVWSDFIAHAGRRWSDWSRSELLGHWLLASFGQFAWLLPLVMLAFYRACTQLRTPCGFPATTEFRNAASGALFWGTLGIAVMVLPVIPFPRNLVPLLPLFALVTGALVIDGVGALGTCRNYPGETVAVILALLVFAVGHALPACAGLRFGQERPADLCRQFYHQDYSPQRTWQRLHETFAQSGMPVMLDTEASWTLGLLRGQGPPKDGLLLIDFQQWQARYDEAPRFVVADSGARVQTLLAHIGLAAPLAAEQVWSTGHFKLFRLRWSAVDEGGHQ